MAFSFYQSLRTVPTDLDEASAQLPLLAPGCASGASRCRSPCPALIWNMMMSMSGGWFFVVASEAITRRRHHRQPAGHRLVPRARDRRSTISRAVGWAIADHAGGHPDLRPAPVPAARGLGRQVPLRADAGAQRAALLGADDLRRARLRRRVGTRRSARWSLRRISRLSRGGGTARRGPPATARPARWSIACGRRRAGRSWRSRSGGSSLFVAARRSRSTMSLTAVGLGCSR